MHPKGKRMVINDK
jgi:hypothetical protein